MVSSRWKYVLVKQQASTKNERKSMKATNTTNIIVTRKSFLLAGLLLAVITMVGCGHGSTDENPPASTNSANGQPMPGTTVSNNAATPPAVANPGNTNNPGATNQ